MTLNRQPRSTVGWALVVAFLVAVVAVGGVFYGLVYLLDFQEIDTTAKLDAKTLFELVKISFGVVAGAGALVALVVAYRRQRVDEAGAHREATRLHTERFSQAVEQLGSDSLPSDLGASTPWPVLPTMPPTTACARPASMFCAPTSSSPSPRPR